MRFLKSDSRICDYVSVVLTRNWVFGSCLSEVMVYWHLTVIADTDTAIIPYVTVKNSWTAANKICLSRFCVLGFKTAPPK